MPAPSPHPVRDRLGLAVAALLTTGAGWGLAGCGGDEEPSGTAAATSSAAGTPTSTGSADAEPSESSSPGTGTSSAAPEGQLAAEGQLAGEGYTLQLPEGWQDATEQFQEYSPLIDAGAVNAEQAGQPFSDNINVLRNADQPELPISQAERQFADELGTVATRVRVQDRGTVDGVEAVHLTGRTDAGEVTALTDQFISYVDGAYYVVTFSYGTGTPRDQREEEVAAMLASWSWG